MSEDIKPEDVEKKEALPSEAEKEAKAKAEAEQDPLKTELEKVKKGGRTKKEKLMFTKKRVEQQLEELGEDVSDDIEEEDDDDNKPLTRGDFKRIQQKEATKTALQLTDDIENETERELARFHLQNTIRSTGNPKEDLRLAMNQVNAVKNAKVLEELSRKKDPKRHSSESSSPGNFSSDQEEELTSDEMAFMKPPFNMTKDQIIKTRTKS